MASIDFFKFSFAKSSSDDIPQAVIFPVLNDFKRSFDFSRTSSLLVVMKPPSSTLTIFGEPVDPIMISEYFPSASMSSPIAPDASSTSMMSFSWRKSDIPLMSCSAV